jgi:small-conductance mechanosensitive channel
MLSSVRGQKHSRRRVTIGLLFLAALFVGFRFVKADDPINRESVLQHLNEIITWYRDSSTKVQVVGLPSDAIYQDTCENLAQQAVRLAFQSAQAAGALLPSGASATSGAAGSSTSSQQQQSVAQIQRQTEARIDQNQAKIEDLDKQIATATRSKKQELTSQRDALKGEIALDQATLDAIQKITTFLNSTESGAGGFAGSIADLARTVPDVLGDANAQKAAAAKTKTTTQPTASKSSGLVGRATTLYAEVRAMHEIDQLANETERVRQTATQLRQPLRAKLLTIIQQGRQLANQTPSADPAQSQAMQQQLQSLTDNFKKISNVVIPLSQEVLILDQSKSNFFNWRNSLAKESKNTLRSLITSAAAILLAVGLLWVLSEVWRRWTFRYIHDVRRRRQFMLLRRFVMGFLMAAVLTLGIVSDFSSLATFAGFATAGIAVGLQAVLLSVAAYFFVIGRYGIRIGDRVSIAGVTGDVIDVSLVRFYLMELAGPDVNPFPTGRIVVFSNSVLFQATTPLYKQIPGTDYTWHEVVFQLVPGADYKPLAEKMLAAINKVYDRYRKDIESQHTDLERRIEIEMKAPEPQTKLYFADTGLELLVRYPTEIHSAAEVDDEIIKTVLDGIEKDQSLKALVSGLPRIRAAVKF